MRERLNRGLNAAAYYGTAGYWNRYPNDEEPGTQAASAGGGDDTQQMDEALAVVSGIPVDEVPSVMEVPVGKDAPELLDDITEVASNAPSVEEAEDATEAIGTVAAAHNAGIDLSKLIPGGTGQIADMTRVERKEMFAKIVGEMIASPDEHTKNMGLMFGLLAQDAMKVKFSDRVKDALDKFAKKAGAAFAVAFAGVAAAIAVAKDKIGKAWHATKPARDKIKSAFKTMFNKIKQVMKPVIEKGTELAHKAGVAIGKAADYVGEKAKIAGHAVSEKAKQAGRFVANTTIGKTVSRGMEKAGIKMRYAAIAAAGAVGAKLAAAGASMQKSQQTKDAAAATIAKHYKDFKELPEEEKQKLREVRGQIKEAKKAKAQVREGNLKAKGKAF